MDAYPRFVPVGDAALTVEFGDVIDPALNAQVAALDRALAAAGVAGVVETVPTYRSLLVCYEPAELDLPTLVAHLRALVRDMQAHPAPWPGRSWDIPVLYGTPHGADLEEVARRLGLTCEAVIAAHSQADYMVYMVGFAPGLPLLGGLPDCLRLPRRAAPRPQVPAGSVIIAAAQAAVTSVPVPSGWHILGRTPVRPFDPRRDEPFLFRAGDRVRFRPVGAAEFAHLSMLAEQGLPLPNTPEGP